MTISRTHEEQAMIDERREVPLWVATAGQGTAGPWSTPFPFSLADALRALRELVPRRRSPLPLGMSAASGGGA